jgi:hypothetical protein
VTTWYRHRRLLLSRWLRVTHWEYWPAWLTYIPVAAYIIWLMARHRSAMAFTAANPAMPAAGFIGESKIDILRGLGTTRNAVAPSAFIDATWSTDAKLARAAQLMHTLALDLPVVLKPNVGQRGAGVVVARTQEELARYLESAATDTILQQYVPGVEFGVFYYRRPSAARGRIVSITEKQLPAVVGDGRRSLERLILEDRRALGMARFHLRRHPAALADVPLAGTRVSLGDCGSHCRGATFLEGSQLLTPALDDAIDEIARGYPGFYFGRFDVRAPSVADFTAGRFTIIELNGVTSEPTHIYDPRVAVTDAYRALFEQWRLAFEIGSENVTRGAKAWSLFDLVHLIRQYREPAGTEDVQSRRYSTWRPWVASCFKLPCASSTGSTRKSPGWLCCRNSVRLRASAARAPTSRLSTMASARSQAPNTRAPLMRSASASSRPWTERSSAR